MPFRILKIKFPKGAWRKPLFLYNFLRRYQPIANRIKGITVEIGGDTTKLQTALKGVNGQIKNLTYGQLL